LGVTHIGSNIHFNNTEVTLVIGGIDPTRTYHQWDQVVIELKKHGIHQCVLIGTGEYAQQEAFKIKQELGSQLDIVNLVNKTSMQECIQLLQNTQTLLTADGGMMHMGVACGIPKIVSLFTKGIDASYRLPQVHLEGAIQGQSSQINDIDPAIIIERFKRLQQLQQNHLK
jgi:ADP-heptose:LPS heptosyltransferase